MVYVYATGRMEEKKEDRHAQRCIKNVKRQKKKGKKKLEECIQEID